MRTPRMKEGDIVLTPVPQADGQFKNRPALFLRTMPPYNDALVCENQYATATGFDEVVRRQDADFPNSGLAADSLIRLGFLALIPQKKIIGSIGAIAAGRHQQLLKNLSRHLFKQAA